MSQLVDDTMYTEVKRELKETQGAVICYCGYASHRNTLGFTAKIKPNPIH